MYLHADNCTGQNKNNTVIQYLVWRAITERHTNITMSFLVVGHTKFAPDWCFGLFKRLYHRTRVGSLKTICEVVEKSAQCNKAQLVVDSNGEVIVPTYDWTDFLCTRFNKIPRIKQKHHFRMLSSEPGVVYTRDRADGPETKHYLLKPGITIDPDELPDVIQPKGLQSQRQWYLYDSIREFCPEEDQDITCPLPSVPKPVSRQGTPQPPTTPPPSPPLSLAPPAPKRMRACSKYKETGHNARTCPKTR